MLKLVDKDPFSSGTEHMMWEERNCDRCVKSAHYRGEDVCGMNMYTKCRCSISATSEQGCSPGSPLPSAPSIYAGSGTAPSGRRDGRSTPRKS